MDDGDMGYGIWVRVGVVFFDFLIVIIFVIFGVFFVDINCWLCVGSRNIMFRVNLLVFFFFCLEFCDIW